MGVKAKATDEVRIGKMQWRVCHTIFVFLPGFFAILLGLSCHRVVGVAWYVAVSLGLPALL